MSAHLPGWSAAGSPFHEGEQALQERAGVRERMEMAGRRVIRDFMPDQHRELFAELPFVLVGSLDALRRPWSSILVGRPGFVSSPDPRTLKIDTVIGFGDPLQENLKPGAPVAVLGIQLETRRRNRMNGIVSDVREGGFDVHVEQSFGNCPQYIQARTHSFVAEPSGVARTRPVLSEEAVLSDAAASMVRRADTIFIATASPAAGDRAPEGVDVSHRGGKPGFVRVTEENGRSVLTSPDFRGNSFFNTLGNLTLNPRAGIIVIDFDTGDLLSVTGEGEVVWDGPEVQAFAGAQRLLRFRVSEGVRIPNAVPLRWSAPEPAKQLASTGTWGDPRA